VLLNPAVPASYLPPSFVAAIGTLNTHCNPVQKVAGGVTTPITNGAAHLVCWGLKPTSLTLPTGAVIFHNQFGNGALKFLPPATAPPKLCLPSWKATTAGGLPAATAPPGLDHFVCFPVVNPAGTPAFKPPATVGLTDQWFAHASTVAAPVQLCESYSKVLVPPVGTPIVNSPNFLVCFSISQTTAFTGKQPFVKNQFGVGQLNVPANGNPNKLCVPSIVG
jgi:hypothetical protein